MVIKTLSENTSVSKEYGCEHGLSLLIETKKHKILFDTGASDLFIDNAEKMGEDIATVDIAIISHGHYDHGGGLKAFLNANSKAKVYINHKAFDRHFARRPNGTKAYIGLDASMSPNERFIYAHDELIIDDGLKLFSNVKGRRCFPSGNGDLFMEERDSMILDDFSHEQNLIIREDGKILLVAGCAHNGIVNILGHIQIKENILPTHVIGGFHLYNRSADKFEDPAIVRRIGEYLKNTKSQYYTGHCTGIEPYGLLKKMMSDQIQYLSAGSQIII